MQAMLDDGIATRKGVMAIHEEESYPRRRASTASHRSRDARRADAAAIPRADARAAGLRDRAPRRARSRSCGVTGRNNHKRRR